MAVTMRPLQIALLIGFSAGLSACGPSQQGQTPTPDLDQVPHTIVYETKWPGEQHILQTSDRRSRWDFIRPRHHGVAVTDLIVGRKIRWDAADPQGTVQREPMRQAPEDSSFHWNGHKTAYAAGPCEAAGEHGTRFEFRDRDNVVWQAACLTDDGVMLIIEERGEVQKRAIKVERGPVPPQQFLPPAGLAP